MEKNNEIVAYKTRGSEVENGKRARKVSGNGDYYPTGRNRGRHLQYVAADGTDRSTYKTGTVYFHVQQRREQAAAAADQCLRGG